MHVNLISFGIVSLIVIYNQFIISAVIYRIVRSEHLSTKTKFNINYSFKLSIALFINTAIISFIVDILMFDNYNK